MSHTAPPSGPDGPWAETAPPEGTPEATSEATPESFWRRVPLWGWIVAGVAAVAVIVIAVILLTPETPEPIVLDPVTVTAEAPTPGVDPIERAPATAFETALPDVVRGFALAADAPAAELITAGALEGRALTYTDGADTPVELALLAGQWDTVAAADARFGVVLAALGVTSEVGDVLADGEVVGRFAIVEDGDDATAVWTNGSSVLQLSGPADSVREVYRAFPL